MTSYLKKIVFLPPELEPGVPYAYCKRCDKYHRLDGYNGPTSVCPDCLRLFERVVEKEMPDKPAPVEKPTSHLALQADPGPHGTIERLRRKRLREKAHRICRSVGPDRDSTDSPQPDYIVDVAEEYFNSHPADEDELLTYDWILKTLGWGEHEKIVTVFATGEQKTIPYLQFQGLEWTDSHGLTAVSLEGDVRRLPKIKTHGQLYTFLQMWCQ